MKHLMILFLITGSCCVNARISWADAYFGGGRIGGSCFNCGAPAPADPCATTTVAGTVCACGPLGGCTTFARYVGMFDPLDGNGVKKYMTTPADAGLKEWAPVYETNVTARSTTDGRANTTVLEGKGATYAAGYYCGTLVANGYSDWYLPAKNELNLLDVNKVAIGGFDVSGNWPATVYWSSTEYLGTDAWRQVFSNGGQDVGNKVMAISVRCVRRY